MNKEDNGSGGDVMSTPKPNYESNIESIRDTIQFFCYDGDLIELRALNVYPFRDAKRKAPTVGGWYTHWGDLATDAAKIGQYGEGNVYFCLNPIVPDANKAKPNTLDCQRATSNDKDILLRRWLFLDFDPDRPPHCASTDAEKAMAMERMDQVTVWLGERGFEGAAKADSGNGYHLYYFVDLPVSKETDTLVKSLTDLISDKFGGNGVKIDKVVANRARITRFYGTWNRKGAHTAERPHRISQLLTPANAEWVKVPQSAIEAVVTELKPPAQTSKGRPSRAGGTKTSAPFDLEAWLTKHQISYAEPVTQDDGREKWVLDACPFNPDHAGKDAAVFRDAEGKLGFKCFHDSCANNHWGELRKLFEPDYTGSGDTGTGELVDSDLPPDSDAARLYLHLEDNFDFRRNVLSGQIEFRPKNRVAWSEFTDTEANTIKVMAVRDWGLDRCRVSEIGEYTNSLYVSAYHPVKEYLDGLTWDNGNHIDNLCRMVKTENDSLWRDYVRAWLIRAVDQVVTGTANEYMLILSGGQGIGKTTFAQALVPSALRRAHFRSGRIDISNKDGLGLLAQMWVICDDELNGLRKQEVEQVKQMLSHCDVVYRPPYGRTLITRPRLASFVGGTNEDRFLTDPTGSRRFLAIEAESIQHVELRDLNIDGVWAEAKALYDRGERGYLNTDVRSRQNFLNDQKMEENVFDFYVDTYASPSDDKSDWLSTTEFAHYVGEKLAERNIRQAINSFFVKQLGSALKKQGHKQDRNGGRKWKIAAGLVLRNTREYAATAPLNDTPPALELPDDDNWDGIPPF